LIHALCNAGACVRANDCVEATERLITYGRLKTKNLQYQAHTRTYANFVQAEHKHTQQNKTKRKAKKSRQERRKQLKNKAKAQKERM